MSRSWLGLATRSAECVVHLGRSYPREAPSCSGPVPTAKTTLNPAHVRPERRALQNEPRLDDTIKALKAGHERGLRAWGSKPPPPSSIAPLARARNCGAL